MGVVLKRELVGRQSMALALDKYTAIASMHPCGTRTDGGVGPGAERATHSRVPDGWV